MPHIFEKHIYIVRNAKRYFIKYILCTGIIVFYIYIFIYSTYGRSRRSTSGCEKTTVLAFNRRARAIHSFETGKRGYRRQVRERDGRGTIFARVISTTSPGIVTRLGCWPRSFACIIGFFCFWETKKTAMFSPVSNRFPPDEGLALVSLYVHTSISGK